MKIDETSPNSRTPPPAQRRLVERLALRTPTSGGHDTPWPGLRCFRSDGTTALMPTVYSACLCIVAQGAKRAILGQEVYRYDASSYLVIGASLPVAAAVVEASAEKPFLSLVLDIGTSAVHELLSEMEEVGPVPPISRSVADRERRPPIRVSNLDAPLLDAMVRFFDALDDPTDLRVLAPGIFREIVYLTLRGDQGDLLRLAASRGGHTPSVFKAIRLIESRFDQRLDVPTIASEVGMSTSSLHHVFKAVTTLTPIQYLERHRLHRALSLMMDEGCQAAEAALRVGYASPSYFSRKFKGLYGLPPRRYVDSHHPGGIGERDSAGAV